eukprot:g837.t1
MTDYFQKLFTDDGDLVPRFRGILVELFRRFDVDGDCLLSPNELNDYARACNGAPFSRKELEEVRQFLDTKEIDGEHYLTIRGFTELYHTQSAARPEDTMRDLRKLGYGENLQKLSESESQE